MLGFKTLWQAGTDHAGIATQMVVERKLTAHVEFQELILVERNLLIKFGTGKVSLETLLQNN